MADEEHPISGGQEGKQPVALPVEPPKHMPYVKPMLYVKQTAGSIDFSFKNYKTQYPAAIPLVVCFVYFVVMVLGGVNPFFTTAQDCLEWGGGQRESIYVDGEFWRLVTNVFAHADAIHLMSNAASYVYGAMFLLEIMSPRKVVWVFVICGVVGSLVCSVTNSYVFLGASGGVLGFYGAFIGYALLDTSVFQRHKTAFYIALGLVALSILSSFRVGISLTIHAVGLLTGFLIGCVLPLWKERNAD